MRDSSHTCHVCETSFASTEDLTKFFPQPPCCPACDAPRRVSRAPGRQTVDELLEYLAGERMRRAYVGIRGPSLTTWVLDQTRASSDLDALFDAAHERAAGDTLPKWATRGAESRLHEQVVSGLLTWRLEDLRERSQALHRAEQDHHRRVYEQRAGRP